MKIKFFPISMNGNLSKYKSKTSDVWGEAMAYVTMKEQTSDE